MVTDTKIPKGYRQTDIGVIPNDWNIEKLGDVCKYQNGTSLEKYFNQNDGYNVISIGNYSPFGKYIENNTYISFDLVSLVKKFILNKDDLTMILNDKTSSGAIIGRVLLIDENNKYVFNQRTMRLTPQNKILPKYLYFLINSNEIHNKIIALAKPGTQIYINTNDVTELQIAFPESKIEQAAIATVLSGVDNLINSLEKLIVKKRDIKQGTMQELLTGKRRLPGFMEEWEVKKIGEMLGYERPDKYIVESTDYVASGDVPVLTANKSFVLGYTNETKGIYKDIPVIIFDDFTTDSKYVYFPFKVKSSAIKILQKKASDIDLKFIFERMQLIKFPMGGHKRYYISEYQHTDLKVPKFEEQTAIAKVLSDMDDEIERLERKRDKYKAIKQGMMQVLLTGRIRLV